MTKIILSVLLTILTLLAIVVLFRGYRRQKRNIMGYKYSILAVIIFNIVLVVSNFNFHDTVNLAIEKSMPILTLLIFKSIYVEFYKTLKKKESHAIKYVFVHVLPYIFIFLMTVDFLRVVANPEMVNPGIDIFGEIVVMVLIIYQLFVYLDILFVNITCTKASLERYRQVYIANVFVGVIYVVITTSIFFLNKVESNIMVSGVIFTLYIAFLTVNYVRPEWLPHAQTEPLVVKEEVALVLDRPVRSIDRRALDSLTGVFNREYFIRHVKTLDTNDDALTVVLINVTGLQLINQSFGYEIGDEILQEVSVILNEVFQTGTIARMSGSLFAILLSGLSADDISEKIRVVKNTCSNRDGFIVNLYFGLYMRKARDLSAFDVYKRAEEELYYNKVIVNQKHQDHIATMLYKNFGKLLPKLSDHLKRCSDMCYEFGQRLHLSEEQLSDLKNAALLHDIALTIMPTFVEYNVAFKDAFEKRVYRSHASRGYDIAIESGINSRTAKAIMHHHENYNGSGYPHSLENEDIPLLSQIVAIVDLVDMVIHYGPQSNEVEFILKSKINVVFSEELIYNMIAFLKEKKIIEETI